MTRAPVVPDTEHRPAAVSEKLAALTAMLAQQHEAQQALDALNPTYESRHTTDGDATLAALEAEPPAPQPQAPAVELRYMKATNHLNACTRKAADLATELTSVIQTEARDWYAAELQAAEALESEVEADWAAGVVRLPVLDAYARQWSVVSWVRIARAQVRDWTPPVDAAARNLRPGCRPRARDRAA